MKRRLLLLLCLLVTAGSAAWAEIAHGTCKNGTWVIDNSGKLTVRSTSTARCTTTSIRTVPRGTAMPTKSQPSTSAPAVRTSGATPSTDFTTSKA